MLQLRRLPDSSSYSITGKFSLVTFNRTFMLSCNCWHCKAIRNSTKKKLTEYIELIPTFQLHNEHSQGWEKAWNPKPKNSSIFKSSSHVTHYMIYTNVKIELVTVKGQLKKKLNRKGEKAEGKCNKILHIYFGKILTVLREDYRLIE